MTNWVVSSAESVVKQQITVLEHLIFNGIDTSLFQFACLEQFMSYIGFKLISNDKVWHIIDIRKGSSRKYMSLEDAVRLYNTPRNVNDLIDKYRIEEGIFQDFHLNIKTVAKLKLKRCKGNITTTSNFVRFRNKD